MKKIIAIILFLLSFIYAQRPITAEDIVNMRSSTQPTMNNDGTQIAYVKVIPRTEDEKRGGSFREVWVMNRIVNWYKEYLK